MSAGAAMKEVIIILSRSGVARSEESWRRIATHLAEWISPDSTCNDSSLHMVLVELKNSTNPAFAEELRYALQLIH